MSRRKTSDSQKERNKKGKDRMDKFDEKVKDEPVVKAIISTDEYEEYTVTGYQKIDPGEWEKVEISYKRKKR